MKERFLYRVEQSILLAVDCIIFGFDGKDLQLLLFKRKVEPLKGRWSLVGSFVPSHLSVDEGARSILKEYTGLDNIYMDQLKTYGEIERDPGARVVSTAYYSLIRLNELEIKSVEDFDAKWFRLEEIPELILDHRQMINDAIDALRLKAKHEPLGFELLPHYFTLPQLQSLYESIYQERRDSRNFRKKVLSLNILIKTDKKDKQSSKKGAFLYTFEQNNSNEHPQKDFYFNF